MKSGLRFMVTTPRGLPDPAVAIAGCRAGAVGVLDLGSRPDGDMAAAAVEDLVRYGRMDCGLRLEVGADGDAARGLIARLPENSGCLVIAPSLGGVFDEIPAVIMAACRERGLKVLAEVSSRDEAAIAVAGGVDGLIAKGSEAGGRIGEETTFVLLQRLLQCFEVGVWARGGIGLHSAAACAAAGAEGVVLGDELLLVREASVPKTVRQAVAGMDGSETIVVGAELGRPYRYLSRPGCAGADALQEQAGRALAGGQEGAWSEFFFSSGHETDGAIGWDRDQAWPVGQDGSLAARLAGRFVTTGGVVTGMRAAVEEHLRAARADNALAPGGSLARAHGTRFPVVQGPMTRVSDVAPFVAAVAEAGGLPFVALALLRAPEVEELLEEVSADLADRAWGVGILGFVPKELREEQLEVVRRFRPPFALIAGGRPDQASALAADGITAYLHVPSPRLLELFWDQGARHFVFEGRECGGHIGPRSSFVLWDQLVSVLIEKTEDREAGDLHVLFAGGIHDARSAAMVAALAAPLSSRGAKIGVLMGTAYLFTEEAVSSGAIVPMYQEVAIGCAQTSVLETGPGHATRCAPTTFATSFLTEKAQLLKQDRSPEEIRNLLESMNLGKLRLAAKGIDRNPAYGDDPSVPKLVALEPDRQTAEGMYMIGQVAALRDEVTTMTDLHREVSEGACERLAETPTFVEASQETPAQPLDIAIVGMACLLPGATDISSFWDNVVEGVETIGEVPPERWEWQRYFDEDRAARDKVYSKWGGFLPEIAFDPLAYGMPPSTLHSIEPLQLLSLEVVRAALADAGFLDREFSKMRASVILGAGGGVADLGNRYAVRSTLPTILDNLPEEVWERLPEWTEDSFAGLLLNVAAGRAANRFDLGGLNMTVDAACASSLAAIYVAAEELAGRRSDVVIAGGIDTAQNPFGYLCFSKTHALSPRGKARVFDATADGIVISEGLAMVVLKRLTDAERDGDRIYAVLRGVGGSSDGRGRSMTAPRPEGQMRALDRAYRQAGYSPATVGLFEAHGTGTAAGDLAEAETLRRVLEAAGAEPESSAVGSVKSMIGHTKCAAGVTGLIKMCLALHRKVLPPTINVDTPNPKAGFGDGPLYVNSELRPWVAGAEDHPRRAGVSAFGFGGTNFHATIEEYTGDPPSTPQPAVADRWPSELLVFRGPRDRVLARLQSLQTGLETGARPRTRDLAFSCWEESRSMREGVAAAVVFDDLETLADRLGDLRRAIESDRELIDPVGTWFRPASEARCSRLAMIFPGQGSQYPNMLADLAVHFRVVREEIERAEKTLRGSFERPLGHYLFPPPAFNAMERRQREDALRDTRIAQPALGAVEIAAFRLLGDLGVAPDMVCGHSYGEYAALAAAGVFGSEELARLSEARGRWIVDAATRDLGTMAAVAADPELIGEIVDNVEDLWIANFNAPRQTVISGSIAAVDEAIERLKRSDVQASRIPVSCGFHSPLVAPARDRLEDVLTGVVMAAPSLPVYSNSTAGEYPNDPGEIRELLAQHLVTPVRFSQEIEAMYEAGARIFLEVGPKKVLTGLVDQILDGRPHLALALDRPGRARVQQLQHVLGALVAEGRRVNLDPLFGGRNIRRLDMDRLNDDVRSQPLPASTWMVSGGAVRPLHEKVARKPPLAWSVHAPPSAVPAEPAAGTSTAVDQPAVPPSAAAHAVQEFQRSMSQLIESQERVMLAYLGASQAEATPVDLERPVRPQVRTAVEDDHSEPLDAATAIETGSAEPVVEATVSSDDVLARLVAIVVVRTGYPAELVDADASLEADLGIDSIKRVEILGELQRSLPEGSEQHLQVLMDELTSAPSLAAIAARIAEAVAGAATAGGELVAAPAADVALEASAPSEDEVLKRLLEIVVDRTGYPAELVGAEASLEADLGIDSIKRVEILGEVQRSLPEGAEQQLQGQMDELTSAPSLAAIASRIAAALEGAAESPAVEGRGSAATEKVLVAPSPQSGATEPLPRTRIEAVRTAEPPAAGRLEGTVVIVDDGRGLGSGLCNLLEDHGAETLLMDAADLDPDNGADLAAQTFAAIDGLAGVVYLPPNGETYDLQKISFADWRQRLRRETGRLFTLAQIAAPVLAGRARDGVRPRFVAATALGGQFALGERDSDEGVAASHGGICGLVKTLAVERPELAVKVVDLDLREPTESLAAHLMTEILSDDGHVEVGWRHGSRWQPYPVMETSETRDEGLIGEDSVVLLTGGARGITADIAQAVATRHHCSLVLVGRSPAPEEERETTASLTDPGELRAALLEERRENGRSTALADVEADYRRLSAGREMRATFAELDRAGVRWEYIAADVRDPDDVTGLAARLRKRHGRLDAIIHGAGTIEDKLLADKSWDSFERVFETKALGAFLLLRELGGEFDSLRIVTFFSSVAGAFPNRGQADYVAGNEVMNKLALTAVQGGTNSDCRVVALNWGPWEKGMAGDGVQRQFRARGIEPIGVADGCTAFLRELEVRDAAAVLVLGRGPWADPEHSGDLAEGGSTGDDVAGISEYRPAAASRPMLNHSHARGAGEGFTLERILDPAIDVYLDDHRLDGRPVLPMAAALEMMVELAELGWPALTVTEVRELSVFKGVALSEDNNHRKSVRFDARVVDDRQPDTLAAQIEVRDADDPRVLYYRSTVMQARSLDRFGTHRPAKVERAFPLSIADAYQKYLFHGHRFAHIERIEGATRSGLLAQIRPSDPEAFINGGSGDWLIDPVVVDSGLQMVLLWTRNEYDVTPLPARFARYRRFGPLIPSNGGPIFCELQAHLRAGASMVVADLTFFEEDGNVLGILDGLECPASRDLNRLCGNDRPGRTLGSTG